MKLNRFDNATLPKQRTNTSKPYIAFGKAGVININQPACDLMNLKAGDKITLAQDDNAPENWFVFKDPENGFVLRGGYDKKGCQFNHSMMVKNFVECFGLDADKTNGAFIADEATKIEGDDTEYWGMLSKD